MKQYDFAYICVNILRKEETKKTISTLKECYPNCKVYVGDQDKPSDEMIDFYKSYDVNYYYLPFDCGLSVARNILIEKVIEPYIMWGDNDFIFDETSNIYSAIDLLKAKRKIGVVGGLVIKNGIEQHYERITLYDNKSKILVYIPLEYTQPKKYFYNNNEYYYCDLTFNYAIAKKRVFKNKKIRWNEDIKIKFEHGDLFLKLKLYSKFKVAYLPNMKVHHIHSAKIDQYSQLRARTGDGQKFADYWNLKMDFTIGETRRCYENEEVTSIQTLRASSKLLNNSPLNKTTSAFIPDIAESFIPKHYQLKCSINLKHLISILNNSNISYVVLKTTCLETVLFHKLKSHNIYLGFSNEKNLEKAILLMNKFKGYNFTYTLNLSTVNINKTKKANLYNEQVNVPLPVVKYLENLYGKDWRKYEK